MRPSGTVDEGPALRMAIAGASVAAACPDDLRAQLRVVARLLLERLAELHADEDPEPGLRALGEFAAARLPPPPAGRFTRIVRRLGLSETESLVLAAALSADADPRFAAAWEQAGRHDARPRPTVGLLRDVLGAQDEIVHILAENHPLRLLRLLQGVDHGSASPYDYTVVPSLELAGWLSAGVWDESGVGVELTRGEALVGDVVGEGPDLGRTIAGLRARWGRPQRRRPGAAAPMLLCIEGMPGTGRGYLAEAIAGALGLDVATLTLDERFAERVPALLRAALLAPACPVLVVPEENAKHLAGALRPFTALYDGPLLLVCSVRPAVPAPWGVVELPTRLPSAAVRERLWRRALGDAGAGETVARTARFPLGRGAVFRAASNAVAAAATTGAVLDEQLLAEAARGELATSSQLCERIRGKRRLDDLVASPELRAQIGEILAFARHRRTAYQSWGLDKLGGEQVGLKALFYGPPGTGKTMAAQILATELDADLYRVDLSNVVSKWVGETEKHLRQVFDQAESTGGMLLFDEADALFAKRTTNVSSSIDRHSNLEVNYLLQRMESFGGICVLTTNHDRILDEAFRRRLNFRIAFLAPDEEEREALWRKLLTGVPHDERVDFATVARRFDMAGGNIRNAVIRSVVLAIDDGSKVGTRHLLEAATREFAEIGRVVRNVDAC